MKEVAKKACRRLFALAAVVSMLAASAFAVGNGAYTVGTKTYYLNPDTGKTDDGGTQDIAVGEGMCRSVIGETGLVEIEGGKTWLTLRIKLLSNIQSLSLKVQGTAGNPDSYYAVSPTIMQEDAANDTADYRFEIPDASSYIQCTAYIIPMSRDVCFYLNAGTSLTAGGGDFVVSVSEQAAKPPAQKPAPEAPVQPAQKPESKAAVAAETGKAPAPTDDAASKSAAVSSPVTPAQSANAPLTEETQQPDERKTQEKPAQTKKQTQPQGEEEQPTKTSWILGGALVLAAAAAGTILLIRKKKR